LRSVQKKAINWTLYGSNSKGEEMFTFSKPCGSSLVPTKVSIELVHFVLHGSESWSLTLREECRLRVFENRVLRRIFGP
jgi:hypothetical protein